MENSTQSCNEILAVQIQLSKYGIDLHPVIDMAVRYSIAMEEISSELTIEERMLNNKHTFYKMGMSRVANRITNLGLPLEEKASWMLVKYGWLGVLDELRAIEEATMQE